MEHCVLASHKWASATHGSQQLSVAILEQDWGETTTTEHSLLLLNHRVLLVRALECCAPRETCLGPRTQTEHLEKKTL